MVLSYYGSNGLGRSEIPVRLCICWRMLAIQLGYLHAHLVVTVDQLSSEDGIMYPLPSLGIARWLCNTSNCSLVLL